MLQNLPAGYPDPAARARFPQIDGYNQNFLDVKEENEDSDMFRSDLIVMNPPFSLLDDVRHVTHASTFLKPGGVLIAIMSPAWTYRTTELVKQFHALLVAHKYSWEILPDNSFSEAGTGVRTGLLCLHKPFKCD